MTKKIKIILLFGVSTAMLLAIAVYLTLRKPNEITKTPVLVKLFQSPSN